MLAATGQQIVLTAAEMEAVVAAKTLNATLKANWFGVIATVVIAAVSALYAFKAVNDEVTSALGE